MTDEQFFQLKPVIEALSEKVESVATWEEMLFIGRSQQYRSGIYRIEDHDQRYSAKIKTTFKVKGVARQMAPLGEKKVLVVLVTDQIMLHNLPELSVLRSDHVPLDCLTERGPVPDTKDCTAFHIKKDNGKYFLAAALPKKIVVFEFRDESGRFVKVKELNSPEKALGICWFGRDLITAFGREYVRVAYDTGHTEKISSHEAIKVATMANLEPREKFVFGKDKSAVRIQVGPLGADTYPACTWPSLPIALTYVDPYLVTISDKNSITAYFPYEIPCQSGERLTFSEHILRNNLNRMSTRSYVTYDRTKKKDELLAELRKDFTVVVDDKNSIFCLKMTDLKTQARIASRQLKFEFAEELCRMCPAEVTKSTTSDIKLHYALHVLTNKSPDITARALGVKPGDKAAMSLPKRLEFTVAKFIEARADPTILVAAFHELLPEDLNRQLVKVTIDRSELNNGPNTLRQSLDILARYLAGQRPKLEAVAEKGDTDKRNDLRRAAVDSALVRSYVLIGKEDDALTFLQGRHRTPVDETARFLESRSQWVAMAMLYASAGRHSQCLEKLRCLGCNGKPELGEREQCAPLEGQPRVLKLISQLNPADLSIQTSSSSSLHKWPFVSYRSLHAKVVDLTASSKVPADELQLLTNQIVGIATSISYLRSCVDVTSVDGKRLHSQYSQWLLRDLPTNISLPVITDIVNPDIPTHKLDSLFEPRQVIQELTAIGEGAVTANRRESDYLDSVLGDQCNNAAFQDLHSRKVDLLVRLALDERASVAAKKTEIPDGKAPPVLLQLRTFLEKSNFYDGEIVVRRLESLPERTYFAKERAVIYLRKKLHEKAISMYLDEVGNLKEAEDYAGRASKESDAFKILLTQLTAAREGDTADQKYQKTQQAIKVINSGDGVDPLSALPMLPDETNLSDIAQFISRALKASHSKRHALEVESAISEAALRNADLQVLVEKRRSVTIDDTDSSNCVKCGRKIRKDTLFAVMPDGSPVHQLCYDNEHIHPTTKQDFRKGMHTVFHQR